MADGLAQLHSGTNNDAKTSDEQGQVGQGTAEQGGSETLYHMTTRVEWEACQDNRTIPSQIVRLLNTKYHYDRCNTKFNQNIISQVQE